MKTVSSPTAPQPKVNRDTRRPHPGHVLAAALGLLLLSAPRPASAATITVAGKQVGIMGEVHPQCLANWGIEMPCAVVELRLDALRGG